MAVYTLPDLPYDYAALEPYISAEIMQLHHDKHHKAYVDGANTALEKLADARAKGDFATINLLEKNLSFNLGGHTNHSIFWENMSPDGGDKPEGALADALQNDLGGFDAFRGQFEAAATQLQGNGWSVLTYDTISKSLQVLQLFNQEMNVPLCSIPLLQLDMWEHAYYLQYKNVKADYVKQWWNVVNWADVQARYETAVSLPAIVGRKG